MFGKKEQIEYLEEERLKLWEQVSLLQSEDKVLSDKIVQLKSDVDKKTSDYETEAKEAAAAARNAATEAQESLNNTQKVKTEIDDISQKSIQAQEKLNVINSVCEKATAEEKTLLDKLTSVTDTANKITESQSSAQQKLEKTQKDLAATETALQTAQKLQAELTSLKEKGASLLQDINTAQGQASKKNSEIENIYKEIFGYTYDDPDTGEQKRAEGKRAELESAYNELKNSVDGYEEVINKFQIQKEAEYKEFIDRKEGTLKSLDEQIRALLPGAMTAGLSHAYEKKRTDEEKSLEKSQRSFARSICFLAVTSIFPIAASLYFIAIGKPISDIIRDLPRIVAAIFPLYIPLFWLAMSANKQVKLSKRLIEEYSHKEALSKTFEGLSSQIEKLGDNKNTDDLRTRLLYNIISTSSENPGKLMKDFHESDNPLFDVLNKSLSLTRSLEKISEIPGLGVLLSPIAKLAEKKLERKNQTAAEEVKKSLECINEDTEKS